MVSEYLRQRRRQILAALLFCVIFALTFLLYRLPVQAVVYPSLLCAVLGALFAALDFQKARAKRRRLQKLRRHDDAQLSALPAPEGPVEREYQAAVGRLCEEYRRAQAAAQDGFADMTDYYSLWVHQIKTPIASMWLTLQNEDSALFRRLSADLTRIEQYVEMVLVFLRLHADTTDYVIKDYDLDGIVRQAIKKFSGAFIERKIRLDYEPLRTTVVTDEKWLLFVIEQVLSNALKYTPQGSIKIGLSAPKTLFIQDTGVGVAPEDLPRIFEKGYTGYNGRSDKRASGLGLYLCRSICRKLGHTITAASAEGEGTTVSIDLAQQPLQTE